MSSKFKIKQIKQELILYNSRLNIYHVKEMIHVGVVRHEVQRLQNNRIPQKE